MDKARVHILYTGRVQGVGFRYTAQSIARGYEVTGWVRNLPDGRVELVAEGPQEEVEAFRNAVRTSTLGSLIENEEKSWSEATGEFRGFRIVG